MNRESLSPAVSECGGRCMRRSGLLLTSFDVSVPPCLRHTPAGLMPATVGRGCVTEAEAGLLRWEPAYPRIPKINPTRTEICCTGRNPWLMGADSFPCSQVSMRVTEFGKIGRIIRGNRPGVNGRLGNVLTFRRWGSFSEASPEFFGIVGFSNCECCIGGVPGCGEFPAMIFFLFDGGVVSDVGVGESEDIVAVGVFAEEHAKPEHLPDVLTGGIEHHFDSGFVPFKQHSEEAAGDVHDGGDIDADGESA
ncbi:MAG: hypothetical protein RL215_1887, partial [Planctomycetota bacterium]